MTPGRKDRASAASLALIALPAACCIGHAALLALAAGFRASGSAQRRSLRWEGRR